MRFMVEGTPSGAFTADLMALLPAESARGRELDAQGIRTAFYLAADMSNTWQVFTAATQEDVQQVLESFPLYHAATFTITPLADEQQTSP